MLPPVPEAHQITLMPAVLAPAFACHDVQLMLDVNLSVAQVCPSLAWHAGAASPAFIRKVSCTGIH
jgi:hypothetical protein